MNELNKSKKSSLVKLLKSQIRLPFFPYSHTYFPYSNDYGCDRYDRAHYGHVHHDCQLLFLLFY